MSDPMQQALALASKNGSRYARALVEVVVVAMLDSEGHAEMARSLVASSRIGSDVQLENTLRHIVKTGPKLKAPHALLSAARALEDARQGLAIDSIHGTADMALRRAVAAGAPIESVERLIAQLNAAA
jgi:hypothetical protein